MYDYLLCVCARAEVILADSSSVITVFADFLHLRIIYHITSFVAVVN